MSGFNEVALSEVSEIIGGGTPKTTIPEYWNGQIPWLSVVDFNTDNRHVFYTEKTITEIGLKNSSTKILNAGDLIISARGTVGALAQLAVPMAFNQSCYGIRANKNSTNDFLYYAIKNILSHVKANTHGSVFDTITRDTFDNLKIFLPPLPEQKAIADTLSCLDEKIELNNKINANLEQTAQAIFKSWFVDFEPFQDGEFVESELGSIPKGWRVVPLGDLCKTITKGTTPTTLNKQFTSSGINFIKAESILDNHSFDISKIAFIDDETNKMLSRSIIEQNDIVFTIAGTLGRFAFVDSSVTPANTNQAIAIIRANVESINPVTLYSYFIGCWHTEFYTKNIQQAVQANISLTTIKSLPILLPEADQMLVYSNLISPIFNYIWQNSNEIRKLAEVRNGLLPKLMSGEIDVSDVEID